MYTSTCSPAQFIAPSLFIHKSRYNQRVRASWPRMLLLTVLASETQKDLKCVGSTIQEMILHKTILHKTPWARNLQITYARWLEKNGIWLYNNNYSKKARSLNCSIYSSCTWENIGSPNKDEISGQHLCCRTHPRSSRGYDGEAREGRCEAMSMLGQVTGRCSEYRMLPELQISSQICQGILDKAAQAKQQYIRFFDF